MHKNRAKDRPNSRQTATKYDASPKCQKRSKGSIDRHRDANPKTPPPKSKTEGKHTHPQLSQHSHRVPARVLHKRARDDLHCIRNSPERPTLNARGEGLGFGVEPDGDGWGEKGSLLASSFGVKRRKRWRDRRAVRMKARQRFRKGRYMTPNWRGRRPATSLQTTRLACLKALIEPKCPRPGAQTTPTSDEGSERELTHLNRPSTRHQTGVKHHIPRHTHSIGKVPVDLVEDVLGRPAEKDRARFRGAAFDEEREVSVGWEGDG